MRVGQVEAVLGGHPGLAQATQQRSFQGRLRWARRRAGADVRALYRAHAEGGGGPGHEGFEHGLHAHVDAFGHQRRDTAVSDAARHDVAEHVQIGAHVESHPVQCAAAAGSDPPCPHPDGGDLARVGPVGPDPDAGVRTHAGGAGQAEVGQRVDHHLFEAVDVGRARRTDRRAP